MAPNLAKLGQVKTIKFDLIIGFQTLTIILKVPKQGTIKTIKLDFVIEIQTYLNQERLAFFWKLLCYFL